MVSRRGGCGTLFGDPSDDLFRARLAAGIVDHNECPFGSEVFGDGSANSFGRPGHDGDTSSEFAHDLVMFVS